MAAAADRYQRPSFPPLPDPNLPQTSRSKTLLTAKPSILPYQSRNKDHILEVLKNYIPASPPATVLEVASGTGQHAHHFAASFPHLTWQPSEATDEMFESIAAWAEDVPNINAPLLLDCSSPPHAWPVPESSCAAVLCINMAHISPWAATAGLCAGAGRVLRPGGVLIVYGPFKADGKPTTPSNADFDALLRSRNAEWGLRDVAEVDAVAQSAGLKRIAMVPMPANNFSLVYNKI